MDALQKDSRYVIERLRSSITISENLTVQRSLFGKEMRYSTYNAIPQYPKSKKHPYETLEKMGISGVDLCPLALKWLYLFDKYWI